MDNKTYGKIGETLATQFLKDSGYKIIRNNYTNFLGEIDIIAYDTKTDYLVFVEVKHRNTAKYGLPREAVNQFKQKKIRQVATLYLKTSNSLNKNIRFDVIDILGDKITHIKNAF